MNYQESITYIHQTPKFARELGNTMFMKLLNVLGNPQDSLKFIHIAGTNGKGSTAAMIAEILRCSGLTVGLFTSPYIERFNERIRVNGVDIPDDILAKIITKLKNTIEQYHTPVSEFALDTAAAFCWFSNCQCDIVVLETGLGGRLDATNVIQENLVTILTSIGMDHMQYLGDSLDKIALEKCGIIKKGCPVVIAPYQEPIVLQAIKDHAKAKQAPWIIASKPEWNKGNLLYQNKPYQLGLKGEFQGINATTALTVIDILRQQGFMITEKSVQNGLLQVKNTARFEWFGKHIILDGGHNLPAAKVLAKSLKKLNKPIHLCVAMMEDKDCSGFAEVLSTVASKVTVTQLPMPRCCNAEMLASMFDCPTEIRTDPLSAVQEGLIAAEEDDAILCCCGSLYFVGHVRPYITKFLNLFL